jgi:riboflavin kinase/FMN adenylyltransferase
MIYGKTVQIRFYDRIREEVKFNGLEGLKDQLMLDKEAVQQILS